MTQIACSLYRLSLALWTGGAAIFTFVVTPAVFRSFGRDTASRVVDSFMGKYFVWNLALSAFSLLLLFLISPARVLLLALAALGAVINAFAAFILGPTIKAVKVQVGSFETEPRDSPARKKFSRLHAVSAVLNLVTLADGVILVMAGC